MFSGLHEKKLWFLEEMAVKLREDVVKTLVEAGSGHSAGPLGMADIFARTHTSFVKWLDHDCEKLNC